VGVSSEDAHMAPLVARIEGEDTCGLGVESGTACSADRKHSSGGVGDTLALGGALRDFDNFTVKNNSNRDNFGEPHTLSNSQGEQQSKILYCCSLHSHTHLKQLRSFSVLALCYRQVSIDL